jgi:hypothetical protein
MSPRGQRIPPHVRALSKTEQGDGCWEYGGKIGNRGYGLVFIETLPDGREKWALAHRVVYEGMVGPIPEGMFLCHHCDNRKCVRPDHIFIGTDADNKADMYAKGRHPHGETHWLSKVTHCPQGHPYSGDNLYIRNCGRRMCRACNNARRKKAHQRAKSAA